MKKQILLTGLIMIFFGIGNGQATLIQNGDFETGNFQSWNTRNDVSIVDALFYSQYGMDNNFALFGGGASSTLDNRLRQNNIDVSAYSQIQISFDWFFSYDDVYNGNNDRFFSFLLEKNPSSPREIFFDIKTEGTRKNPVSNALFGHYESDFIDVSNYSSIRLQFEFDQKNNNISSAVGIDNVAVNPVPEPATMLLFGTGIAGLVATRRRKKN